MYKGITPTIILSLPESSAVLNATNVYVTLADKCKSITKINDELVIEADTFAVDVFKLAYPTGYPAIFDI